MTQCENRCICRKCKKSYNIYGVKTFCCVSHKDLLCIEDIPESEIERICEKENMTVKCKDFVPIEPPEEKQ